MRAWLVVAALLAAIVALPAVSGGRDTRAVRAQEDCGALDSQGIAASFNVFVLGDHRASNTEVQGRLGVGRDTTISSFGVGSRLTRNPARVDLVTGRDLTASNAGANNGSVTYGRALIGSIGAAGTVRQAAPAFVFGDVFTELRSNSAAWGRVAANGQFTREAFGSFVVITFTGTDDGANVFRISADELELAQEIRIRVPFGSTTLVNVTGTEYTTSAKPTTSIAFWNGSSYVQLSDPESNANLEQLRRGLVWNLPDAQNVQIGANLAWQGTLLAPGALVVFPGSTQLNGIIIAENLEGGGSANNHAFNGCLPEPCPPAAHADADAHAAASDPHADRHRLAEPDGDANADRLRLRPQRPRQSPRPSRRRCHRIRSSPRRPATTRRRAAAPRASPSVAPR